MVEVGGWKVEVCAVLCNEYEWRASLEEDGWVGDRRVGGDR